MDAYDELQGKLYNALGILCTILREKLDNYGIYYRLFARIKSGDSIRRKLSEPRYVNDPNKKINDLFGLRLVLYYQDDIEVCQEILENMLINIRWKASENTSNTFDATKNNGTFLLPGFVQKIVDPTIKDLRINPHFEIQLRTVFFEGWHEAEHDMRYKEMELWDDFEKEARKLNSILATLEMCDFYLMGLFDDMGHDFYKNDNWGQMIRYKYRLKTLHGELDETIASLISPRLGKRIFKIGKKRLVQEALEQGVPKLDANTIVYLVNETLSGTDTYNEDLREEYWRIRRSMPKIDLKKEKMVEPLAEHLAFQANVLLGNLATQDMTIDEQFQAVLEMVYESWLKKNLEETFPEEFEKPLHPVVRSTMGVACRFQYDLGNRTMYSVINSISLEALGKTAIVQIEVSEDVSGKLRMWIKKSYTTPENAPSEIMSYSRPDIYTTLGKTMGYVDVQELNGRISQLDIADIDSFIELIENGNRTFPVVLFSVPNEEERTADQSCYGRLVDYVKNPRDPERNNFMRMVGYCCHAFYCMGEVAEKIASILGEDAEKYENGIRFFERGFNLNQLEESYMSYTQEEIFNKPKDIYALRAKRPYFYQTVSGPDAVRHELIQRIYHHILEKEVR